MSTATLARELECRGRVRVGGIGADSRRRLAGFAGEWLEYSPDEEALVVRHVQPGGSPALAAVPAGLIAMLDLLEADEREEGAGGTLVVRERDRLANAFEEPQPFVQVRIVAQVFSERPTTNALHDVEQPAVGEPASVVNRHDAGVFEPGEDACLVAKPAFEAGARERVGNLDRNLAPKLFVERKVNRPHAAASDLLDDRVAAGLELWPAPKRSQPGHGCARG